MSLLKTLRHDAINKGVQYVEGEVTDFKFRQIQDYYVDNEHQGQYEGVEAITVSYVLYKEV